MEATGNGLGGHPKDVPGDNTAVFINPAALERLRVVTVNTGSSAPRFLTAVEVRVKATGKIKWLMAAHLTRGDADRQKEIRTLLTKATAAGVDLRYAIFGGDFNDANDSSQPGARKAAAAFGLTDIRDQLSDEDFTGDSWDTFTGWDPDVEKTGRHIDAILNGAGSRPIKGAIVPVRNAASDHQLVEVEIH
jgi:endonuclease/exonuclease/phosphatase family metal-dependent hydrolase